MVCVRVRVCVCVCVLYAVCCTLPLLGALSGGVPAVRLVEARDGPEQAAERAAVGRRACVS